jgi:hypothetical protein
MTFPKIMQIDDSSSLAVFGMRERREHDASP